MNSLAGGNQTPISAAISVGAPAQNANAHAHAHAGGVDQQQQATAANVKAENENEAGANAGQALGEAQLFLLNHQQAISGLSLAERDRLLGGDLFELGCTYLVRVCCVVLCCPVLCCAVMS